MSTAVTLAVTFACGALYEFGCALWMHYSERAQAYGGEGRPMKNWIKRLRRTEKDRIQSGRDEILSRKHAPLVTSTPEPKPPMRSEDLVGKTIASVATTSTFLTVVFTDGTKLYAGHGDAGTMRDPEPYFYVDAIPPNGCSAWTYGGHCGRKRPCSAHGMYERAPNERNPCPKTIA